MLGESSLFGFETLPWGSEKACAQAPTWSVACREMWVYFSGRLGTGLDL